MDPSSEREESADEDLRQRGRDQSEGHPTAVYSKWANRTMWNPNPYAIALIAISATMLLGVVPVAWRRRRLPGGYAFFALALSTFVWTLGYGVELGAPSLSAKLLLTDLEYLGIASVPVCWFVFALQYTHHGKWLTVKRLIGLTTIPAITLLLLWTNDHHGLIQQSVFLDTAGPFPAIGKTYGPWFWTFYAYSFFLLLVGSVFLLQRLGHWTSSHRGQVVSLLVAVVPPWVANAFHLARIYPIHRLDLTPIAFGVSVLALAFALYRYRLLDLVPLAQDVAVREIGEGLVITDPQWRIVDLNPAARAMLGTAGGPSVGTDVASLIPPLASRPTSGSPTEWSFRRDDVTTNVEVRTWPLTDRWRQHIGNAITLHDISQRKAVERALETANERIIRLHETALKLAAMKEEEGVAGFVVETCEDEFPFASCAMFSVEAGDLVCVGKGPDLPEELCGPFPLDSDRLPAAAYRAGLTARHASLADLPSETWTDGLWRSAICAPIREIGVLLLLSAAESAFSEVDEHWVDLFLQHVEEAIKRIRLQEALREQARRDALTGTYNRRHLPDAIQAEMARARRAGHRLALVMLDINGFKSINDRFGHQVGDRVLKEIGGLLLRHVREYDLVVRYGGDEFLLILPESSNEADAIVDRIREVFSTRNEHPDPIEASLSVAMGVSRWDPGGTEGWEEAVRRADQAMYAEKNGP